MTILIENRQEKIAVNLQQVKQTLNRIMKILECNKKEVSLIFIDDDDIRKINQDYLGRDYPTNVIAFSLLEGEFGDINVHILGDIVISAETALRDANEGDISFDDEVDFLMIHGLLHLLGYDHENTLPEESEKMKNKEKDIFLQLKGYFLE
jgi:probable rRNA maturation factor